jgi:hypothetical protein
LKDLDAGYRLLALFRLWNIVEYWFPYRDAIGEDWDGVLHEFIPRVVAAATRDQYTLVMLELMTHLHDTHANLWSSLDLRPPTGECRIPMDLRFVENRLVATKSASTEPSTPCGLQLGDVIVSLDGKKVNALVEQWRTTLCGLQRTDTTARHCKIDRQRRL